MLIDTHSHIHFKDFDGDRQAVVERAAAAGVSNIITLGTDYTSSLKALAVAKEFPAVFAAAGIHPSDAHHADPGDYEKIRQLAVAEQKIIAIGETGLDFYWEKEHYEAQYENFRQMLMMAKEIELPVVIHNRAAQREMQWFFQIEKFEAVHGVMHCFAGDVADARFYLDMGLHISFTADITRKNFRWLETLKYVPLDRLMIETDSPYIVPRQVKAKRNEPANVVYVAEKIAEIHKATPEEIARITTETARRFFKLP